MAFRRPRARLVAICTLERKANQGGCYSPSIDAKSGLGLSRQNSSKPAVPDPAYNAVAVADFLQRALVGGALDVTQLQEMARTAGYDNKSSTPNDSKRRRGPLAYDPFGMGLGVWESGHGFCQRSRSSPQRRRRIVQGMRPLASKLVQ